MKKLTILFLSCMAIIAVTGQSPQSGGSGSQDKEPEQIKGKKIDTTLVDTLQQQNMMMSSLSIPTPFSNVVPQIIPSSPQSQIFERYLFHDVNEAKGIPEINIPLYEIEIKGLKIPISLSYYGGGVKYKQYDGDAGAGWSVNAEGYRISRTIMGKPDEEFAMYNNSVLFNPTDNGYKDDSYWASIDSYSHLCGQILCDGVDTYWNLKWLDGGYDQFSYMTPSGGGQFIINDKTNRKAANTNPMFDIKISNGGFMGINVNDIKLTDGNGFIYHMGKDPDSTNVVGDLGDIAMTSWLLRKIDSPYKESVRFKYKRFIKGAEPQNRVWDKDNYLVVTEAAERYDHFNPQACPTSSLSSEMKEEELWVAGMNYPQYQEQYLQTEIETDKEIVKFVRANAVFKQLITGIQIIDKSTGAIVKNITFEYHTPTSTDWHILLTGLWIGDQHCNFDYYPAPGNIKNCYADYWGYYKCSQELNNHDLYLDQAFANEPIQYLEHNSSNAFSPYYYPLSTASQIVYNSFPITWVERKTNGETTHAFSLKTITYPTKGTTTYVYETNQFPDGTQQGTPVVRGAGQRIKRIVSNPGDGTPSYVTELVCLINICSRSFCRIGYSLQ